MHSANTLFPCFPVSAVSAKRFLWPCSLTIREQQTWPHGFSIQLAMLHVPIDERNNFLSEH